MIVVLCSSGWLLGQSTAPAAAPPAAKERRFQAGLHLAQQLTEETWGGQRMRTNYYQAELSYRVRRWLDVGLHVGYNDVAGQTSTVVAFNGPLSSETVARMTRRNYLSGLQARFNLRVGQGDLSFAPTAGIVRHQNRYFLTGVGLEQNARVDYRPLNNLYYQFDLSYTYWTTDRVGLTASLSYLVMEHEGIRLSSGANPNSFYDAFIGPNSGVTTDQLQVIRTDTVLGLVRPRSAAYASLGLVFRPF